jgi:GTP-binding protein HflX
VLHVIDASHPQFSEQRDIGNEVLADLGIDEDRVVEVYNKVDRLDDDFDVQRRNAAVVSALTGTGIEPLIDVLRDRQRAGGELMRLSIPHAESRLVAKLHEVAEVQQQRATDEGTLFTAWVPKGVMYLFREYALEAPGRARRAS